MATEPQSCTNMQKLHKQLASFSEFSVNGITISRLNPAVMTLYDIVHVSAQHGDVRFEYVVDQYPARRMKVIDGSVIDYRDEVLGVHRVQPTTTTSPRFAHKVGEIDASDMDVSSFVRVIKFIVDDINSQVACGI